MAFFEELKGISEGSANDPSIELLKVLIERHKKALLDRHLETVYEGLKDTIRERISAGNTVCVPLIKKIAINIEETLIKGENV